MTQSTTDIDGNKVVHRSLCPVMVIGYGSSGTSIVSSLLREYLQIGIGTETQFFVRYYERLPQYGDLSLDRNVRRLIHDLTRERWFQRNQKFGFHADADAIFETLPSRDYRGVLEATLNNFATQLGMSRWGDKTPEYVYHLPIIGELFPDAKYVHMVRDGRDVTNSVMRRYWGSKNAYVGAKVWKHGVNLVDEFVDRLPDNQKIEIRYEDLLQDPVPVFARLIEFLDIEDDDGALIESIASQVNTDLNRENFDKWKNWPREDRIRFERVACDVLRRHGYETILEDADDTFSAFERGYWHLHNRALKWTYPRYWQDNVYRAGLRITDAWRGIRHRLGGASNS